MEVKQLFLEDVHGSINIIVLLNFLVHKFTDLENEFVSFLIAYNREPASGHEVHDLELRMEHGAINWIVFGLHAVYESSTIKSVSHENVPKILHGRCGFVRLHIESPRMKVKCQVFFRKTIEQLLALVGKEAGSGHSPVNRSVLSIDVSTCQGIFLVIIG